jgi:hypothetical protein
VARIGDASKTGFVLKYEPEWRYIFEARLRRFDFFGEYFLYAY